MIPINILNKTKINTILKHLGDNSQEKLNNIINLFDEMNILGYQAGASLIKRGTYVSMNIYYKSVNVFMFSIGEECLKVDLARQNEAETISARQIPIVESIIKNNIFNEKSNHVKYTYCIKNNENDMNTLLNTVKQIALKIDEELEKEFQKLNEESSFLLNDISISNYRMYEKVSLILSSNINLFIGDKNSGKTTFLNAVYHLISAYQFMFEESQKYNKNKININKDMHFDTKENELGLVNTKKADEILIMGDILLNDNHYGISRGKNGRKNADTQLNKDLEQYIKQLEIANRYFNMPILPVFSFCTANQLSDNKNVLQNLERNRFDIYKTTIYSINDISEVIQFLKDCFIEQERYGKTIPALLIIKTALEKVYEKLLDNETVELKYCSNQIVLCIGEKYISLDQMNNEYQTVFAIVANLAYRMVILNPNTKDVLTKTPGLVLIDKIDSYLYPEWQKKFLKIIKDIFPKIQIIATACSPVSIQSLDNNTDKLFLLRNNEIKVIEDF